jgi:PUA domain protein
MIGSIESSLGVKLDLSRSAQASCEEPDEGIVFIHFDSMVFVKTDDSLMPFLGSPAALSLFPSATVDEGAIRFLLNGADIMRPGMKAFDNWGNPGKMVIIKEERKGRAIAVAKSLVSSDEASGMTKGACLKNLHHVGDRYWNLFKKV